jgi:hypothetical protein
MPGEALKQKFSNTICSFVWSFRERTYEVHTNCVPYIRFDKNRMELCLCLVKLPEEGKK